MTELLITPNFDKKAAKFKGTVAAGETVLVRIANAQDIDTENLRLRVLDLNGKTLAMFERHYLEDGAEDGWQNDGEYLTCMLDLNTVEMQTAVCGMCERDLLVVLDDPENDILHFKGECAFQGWPKRKGGDIPYELGEYPDIVENLKSRVNEAEKSIADHVDEADGIVAQANNVKNAAVKAEEAARQAAAYADTAKEEAARQAQSAAESADNLQVAVEEAKSHKNAAQEAQSAAETAKNDAVAAKNAAENARDEAGEIAENTATEIVESVKTTAEDAQRKANTLMGGDNNKSARSIAAEEVAKVVANAPADLDTLKKIADYIESDKTGAAQIVNRIDANAKAITKKVDAEEGKGLSTNDYTTAEKEKLANIEAIVQKLLPYSLVAATIADGTVALQDRAVNAIRLGSDVPECTFVFPGRVGGKARDFMLRLELVGEEMPTLSFVEPDGGHVNFDYTDEDWAAVEQGVNVFMLSDTKEGE